MIKKNSILFTPVRIGNTVIPNRFMRSATYEGRSDEKGYPKPSLLKMIKDLAYGEVGLIVPGFVYPMKSCQIVAGQTGMYTPSHAEAWKSTIDEIHEKTKSKIIFQICHGGDRSSYELTGTAPEVPTTTNSNSRQMTISDIKRVVEAFIEASINLKKAGADGVQLHCAHGFLLSAFLSPHLNHRHDDYGGEPENRIRIVKEIAEGIRKANGPDFFISAKINAEDYYDDDDYDGGITPCVCSWYISQLPMIDLFEISAGIGHKTYGTRIKYDRKLFNKMIQPPEAAIEAIKKAKAASSGVPFHEGYNIASVKKIRKLVPNAKLAVVGGLRKFDTIEKVVKSGIADIVSLSRPFLRQPNLVKKFKTTSNESKCISCGLCTFGPTDGEIKCYYP